MRFPEYPKYKDSGVDWLGAVPAHWDVVALKRIVSLKSGDSITADHIEETGQYPVIGGNGLRGYATSFTHDGHFAIIGRQGALCGNINYGDGKFWASEHAVVASPLKQLDTVWLGEMLRVMNLNQYSVSAAQPGLSVELVGNLRTVFPPIADQRLIADFLNRETAKIDALVAEQRRLIELLKEKRQAVISQAVTKGLNPYAAMKPSGVEWIGDTPVHWRAAALRHFATFNTGSTPDRTVEEYWNGGIPWVKTGEINYSKITKTEETISSAGMASCSVSLAPAGTLLMALYGQGATRGRVALLGIPATYNQACAAIRVDGRLDSRFLHALFISAYPFIREIGNETTQMNLNTEFVRSIRVVVPPIGEQQEIVEFVERENAKLDALTGEAERAIELLQERRTALICAAVTGKIDVRGTVQTVSA